MIVAGSKTPIAVDAAEAHGSANGVSLTWDRNLQHMPFAGGAVDIIFAAWSVAAFNRQHVLGVRPHLIAVVASPGWLREHERKKKEFFAFRIEVAIPFHQERQLTPISRSETTYYSVVTV